MKQEAKLFQELKTEGYYLTLRDALYPLRCSHGVFWIWASFSLHFNKGWMGFDAVNPQESWQRLPWSVKGEIKSTIFSLDVIQADTTPVQGKENQPGS